MRISSPLYLMVLIMLRDPEEYRAKYSFMSVAIRDFFLYIERGSAAITPNQALVVIFKAHSFSLEDIVFPAHTSSADVRLKMFL